MTPEEKLHIAKEAYKAVMQGIKNAESYLDGKVHCHWDGCISIDDELFHKGQLSGKMNPDEIFVLNSGRCFCCEGFVHPFAGELVWDEIIKNNVNEICDSCFKKNKKKLNTKKLK